MCDFRCIKKIRLLGPGEWDDEYPAIEVMECLNLSRERAEETGKPGLYYIPGSGSYHAYWDGKNWLYEGWGWEVVESSEFKNDWLREIVGGNG